MCTHRLWLLLAARKRCKGGLASSSSSEFFESLRAHRRSAETGEGGVSDVVRLQQEAGGSEAYITV